MVKVEFTGALIALAGDPTTEIALGPAEVSFSVTARGEVKQYAGGVRRSITLPGTINMASIKVPAPNLLVQGKLESWVGKTVSYRDEQYRAVWGLLKFVGYRKAQGLGNERLHDMELQIETTTQNPETFV